MLTADTAKLKALNFYPARHHARHIKVIWKQVLLNPLAPTDAPEVDMSSKNLSSLLFRYLWSTQLYGVGAAYASL
jgi:hypothetical protein